MSRVPEFKFIQEEANKLGVKVYLFGGTASAFAHYVRWDLEREAGDEKYQEEKFDYDFTNIYRGNQDLDIVVDGTAEQAATLQQILKEKYPHFVGSKEAWEVRLLKAQVSDKLPLLDNPDFLNQHTDTNSTGMIAVNADPGEIIFRDLFSWENPDSRFLNDVAAGRIKFLFSDSHETTSRFKNGQNPPVFAAIRYLAKLSQYEVDEAEGDLEIIKKIIEGTYWDEVKNNSYVVHKLEEFGKKVLLNAPDSEYAWNLLEETGVRGRLIEMDGNRISSVESLSWWMSKEPLRTKPLGEGNGKTAAEIFKSHMNEDGEIVVAHETNSFEAYENITRSSHGAANAFISRRGISGEAAACGDGFYTRLGLKGARGTNLTIRFVLNPEAREGTDFIYDDDFIVINNKSALNKVPENLNVNFPTLLALLIEDSIKKSDQGTLIKLERRFERQEVSTEDIDQAYKILMGSPISKLPGSLALEMWFDQQNSTLQMYHGIFDKIIAEGSSTHLLWIVNNILVLPNWKNTDQYPRLYLKFIKGLLNSTKKPLSATMSALKHWFSLPYSLNLSNDILEYLIKERKYQWILNNIFVHSKWLSNSSGKKILFQLIEIAGEGSTLNFKLLTSQPHIKTNLPILKKLITFPKGASAVITNVLSGSRNNQHKELILHLIKSTTDHNLALIAKYVLSNDFWRTDDEITLTYLDRQTELIKMSKAYINAPSHKSNREVISRLVDLQNPTITKYLIENVLNQSGWHKYPEILQKTFDTEGSIELAIKKLFRLETWAKQLGIIRYIINLNNKKFTTALINNVFNRKHFFKNKEFYMQLVRQSRDFDTIITSNILSLNDFPYRDEIIKIFINERRALTQLITAISKSKNIDFVISMLKTGETKLVNSIIKQTNSNFYGDFDWLRKRPEIIPYFLLNENKHTHNLTSQLMINNPELQTNENILLIYNAGLANKDYINTLLFNLGERYTGISTPFNYQIFDSKIVTELIKSGDIETLSLLVHKVLIPHPEPWSQDISYIEQLKKRAPGSNRLLVKLLSQDSWSSYFYIIEEMLEEGDITPLQIVTNISDVDFWLNHLDLLIKLINLDLPSTNTLLLNIVAQSNKFSVHIEKIINEFLKTKRPSVKKNLLEKFTHFEYGINSISTSYLANHPDLFIKVLLSYDNAKFANTLINHQIWSTHPVLVSFLQTDVVNYNDLIHELEARDFRAWYQNYKNTNACKTILQ